MTVSNLRYSLTLSSIRAAMDSLKDDGRPLFRVQTNLDLGCPAALGITGSGSWTALGKRPASPVIDQKTFEGLLDRCFSRDVSLSRCGTLNQQNMLFFFLGGYSGFTGSEPSRLSYLFSGNRRAAGDAEIFERDLVRWRCTPSPDGDWVFKDCKDVPVSPGAVSLFGYIAKSNEYIIRKYCSSDSQKDLRELLIGFSKSIYDTEQDVPEKNSPMDPDYVEQLSKHLYMLARLAELSAIDGKQPEYLAEGLTWLFVAALLRKKFPADHEEFYRAQKRICRVADETGMIETVEVRGGWKVISNDPGRELYDRLMERYRYTKNQHPSIRMMEPDPMLFPKGLPAISNAERTAAEEKEKPISIRDMVMKSWEEHKNLLLVGEGGIGKTVAMLTMPDEEWIKSLQIPTVYVPLQSLDIYEGNLTSYIKDCYGSDAERITDVAGIPWEGHPQLLLLLDGFNEIPMEYRRTAERHIRTWMDRPGVQVITTSRISFSLNGKFLEYKLEPLLRETVRAFLLRTGIHEADLPDDFDPLWKVINVPLMLTLFVQTDKAREMAEGSDVSAFLDWKISDNATHIIWNYLQAELYRLMGADRPVLSAAAILAVAPFVCFEMAKSGKFYVEQEDFQKIIQKATQFYSQNDALLLKQVKNIRYKYDKFTKEKLFVDTVSEDYFSIMAEQSVLFQEKENSDSIGNYEIVYIPAHQNFRDTLAAVFICGCMLNSVREKLPFPEKVLAEADFYVKNYMAEFLTDDELIKIWDYHRISEPENGRVTWLLMDLIGRQRDYDFRELDFSGLDLSDISLHRLLSRRLDICPLPEKAELFNNTRLSLKSFIPEGHSNQITSVVFSTDGRHLISGSFDETVRVWNLESGTCRILDNHAGKVTSVAISSDNKCLIFSSYDGTIHFCFLEFEKDPQSTVLNIGMSSAMAFSPKGAQMACGSWDKTVWIWNLNNNSTDFSIQKLAGHTGSVNSVAYSPDGKQLASGSTDKTVRVWDLESGTCRILSGHKRGVRSVAYSPDGKQLASGSRDCTIRVWDLENNTCQVLKGHSREITNVVYNPDGRQLASSSFDKTVRIWDLESGTCKVMQDQYGWVNSIAYSPDGRQLAGGSSDGTVQIWDLIHDSHRVIARFISKNSRKTTLVYSPDGRQLACSSYETIRIWDLENNTSNILEGHTETVRCIMYSPNGKLLASGSSDKTVRIWNLEDRSMRVLTRNTGSISNVMYSPNERQLLSVTDENTIQVWNLENGSCINLKGHTGTISYVAYSPDGRQIASSSYDETVRVWDLRSGTCQILEDHTGTVSHIAYSPDGKRLACSSYETVRIWEQKHGGFQLLKELSNPRSSLSWSLYEGWKIDGVLIDNDTFSKWDEENSIRRVLDGYAPWVDWVSCIAFNRDGSRLLSGSRNGFVRVWNLRSNSNQFLEIKGHSAAVNCVTISLDERHLISSSIDNIVRVWDLESGSNQILKVGTDVISSMTLNPKDDQLAACSSNGIIWIWNIATSKLLKRYRIIDNINLSNAGFEQAIIQEEDKVPLIEAGAKLFIEQ